MRARITLIFSALAAATCRNSERTQHNEHIVHFPFRLCFPNSSPPYFSGMVDGRKPHFLEVFLPALCSNRLKVPNKFYKHLANRTSGSMLLTGPSDNSWHVDLKEHNGRMFFEDGWSTFVIDHAIECGDSLVFRYNGNSNFSVQIFDQSSCEKEEAFQAKCSQEQSNPNGCLGTKRERGREASLSNVFSEKKLRGEWVTIHQDSPPCSDGDQEQEMCSDEHQEMKESVVNGYDNRMALIQTYARSVVTALPALSNDDKMHAIVKFHRGNNASKVKNVCSKNFKVKKACIMEKKIMTEKKSDISKFIEERAAHYFTSNFPYFVRLVSRTSFTKGTLRVPAKFSSQHLPDHKTKVILRNLDGKYWEVTCIPYVKFKSHSITHIFSAGWLAFTRSNGINIEDLCIFELVDKLEMRVHILRLGLEGLESQTQNGNCFAYDVRGPGSPLQNVENVSEDVEVYTPKNPEHTGELSINFNVKQETDVEMALGTQETEYFIDISGNATAVMNPDHFSPLLLTAVPNESRAYDADQSILYRTSDTSGAELNATGRREIPLTAEDETAADSIASPFPNFTKVMLSSNVYGSASLAVPTNFSADNLPNHETEMVFRNLRGDCWNVTATYNRLQTKFCGGWPTFVRENGVKLGDVCIFELIDNRVFQVQVVDGGGLALPNYSDGFVCDNSPNTECT